MSIKIPTGPSGAVPTSEISGVHTSPESKEIDATASTGSTDPVMEIARELAAGKISPGQAVDRLIAQTMDTDMVSGAPKNMREALEKTLRTMIETDPHLRSLARAMGVEDG
jgi:hypothetical protein